MFYSVTVKLPDRSGVWIPGLFTATLYFPIGFLRESMIRPSTIYAFMTAWHEWIVCSFRRTSTFITSTMEYTQEIQALIVA